MRNFLTLLSIFFTLTLFAADEKLEDKLIETQHTLQINGKSIPYKATVGTIVLREEDGKDKAAIFYIAYTKEGVDDLHTRPITFCFNGGPGSSSIWLHLGAFGPRRVVINGPKFDPPPYNLADNPYSLLDITDLVFIDPVSTGYSRAAPGEDVKQFHGVEEDVASVGKFIRIYTTRFARWESPKFVAGESYGSTRAASLADHLHNTYGMYINGVVLISSVLNFQTLFNPSDGNDLPYILYLPSYTATSWYHKTLDPELQKMDFQELIKNAENFALTEYGTALMLGSRLTPQQKEKVIANLSKYTSLTPEYIAKSNLRVDAQYYTKELLRKSNKNIGRFDGRMIGDDIDALSSIRDYDPSYEAVFGAFTAAFYQYMTRELNWKSDYEYKVLTNVSPWNFGKASNSFLNVAPDLREVMIKNPTLRVHVASGIYDLATPYLGIDYTVDHMNLPTPLQDHITTTYYNGGHMMYTDQENLAKLKEDLTKFMNTALQNP